MHACRRGASDILPSNSAHAETCEGVDARKHVFIYCRLYYTEVFKIAPCTGIKDLRFRGCLLCAQCLWMRLKSRVLRLHRVRRWSAQFLCTTTT